MTSWTFLRLTTSGAMLRHLGAVSLKKSHDIVILLFCNIVKGQGKYWKLSSRLINNATIIKDSYSTANESKRQFNRFIIYCLNIVPMVNDSFCKSKWEKINKKNVKKDKMCTAKARSRAVWASHMQSSSRALANWATGIANL